MKWGALKDANGDWAFEEIAATVHCAFTMGAAGTFVFLLARYCILHDTAPNLQEVGVGLLSVGGAVSTAIAAVAAAKRLRGDPQRDQLNAADGK